jgi:hypothetical protein
LITNVAEASSRFSCVAPVLARSSINGILKPGCISNSEIPRAREPSYERLNNGMPIASWTRPQKIEHRAEMLIDERFAYNNKRLCVSSESFNCFSNFQIGGPPAEAKVKPKIII